jgi:hypothetical protein
MHARQPLPSIRARRPETSEGMERLIQWMTEKDRKARPGSYADILDALDHGSPLAPRPASAGGTAWRGAKVSPARLRLFAAVSVAALAAGFAVWRATHWQEPVRPSPGSAPALVLAVTPFYGPDPDLRGRSDDGLSSSASWSIARRRRRPRHRHRGAESRCAPTRRPGPWAND